MALLINNDVARRCLTMAEAVDAMEKVLGALEIFSSDAAWSGGLGDPPWKPSRSRAAFTPGTPVPPTIC